MNSTDQKSTMSSVNPFKNSLQKYIDYYTKQIGQGERVPIRGLGNQFGSLVKYSIPLPEVNEPAVEETVKKSTTYKRLKDKNTVEKRYKRKKQRDLFE